MSELQVTIETPEIQATVHTVELFFTMAWSAWDTGPAGKSFLQGNFDPIPTLGADWDSFLNNVSRDVFYKQSWIRTVVWNIKWAPGEEVMLQTSATHIQWKYTSDTERTDLIALSELKGDQWESVELRNDWTYIQRKYPSQSNWTNLVALSALKWDKGDAGDPVELWNNGTYIQRRYVWDTERINLVALSEIKGDKGDTWFWVPAGGKNWYLLAKKSDTDYDTQWIRDKTFVKILLFG